MHAPRRIGAALVAVLGITIAAVLSPPRGAPLSAPGVLAAIPISWTVPIWFIDPANASGDASDSNDCQTNTTPCLTWHQINDTRWGCQGRIECPRLRQNTTITFLSSHSDNSDPVYFHAALENNAQVLLLGQLPTGQSGTLASVVSKNRSGAQLLNISVAGATLGIGELIINNTIGRNSSRAWMYANVSGSTWALTQPLTAAAVPFAFGGYPLEDDTWAVGDSVTIYDLVKVNIASLDVTSADIATNAASFLNVNHITIFDPQASFIGGRYQDPVSVPFNVMISECSSQRVVIKHTSPPYLNEGFLNVDLLGGIAGGSLRGPSDPLALTFFHGGALSSAGNITGSTSFNEQIDGLTLDGDAIWAPTNDTHHPGVHSAVLGLVYIDTGATLRAGGQVDAQVFGITGQHIVWGPGVFDVSNMGRVTYASGAGKAAATFLNTGGLLIDNQTSMCVDYPTNDAGARICGLGPVTSSLLDTYLGPISGCAGVPWGGAFCNSFFR